MAPSRATGSDHAHCSLARTHEAAEPTEGSGKADLWVHLDDDLLRGYHVEAFEATRLSERTVQDGQKGLRGNQWGGGREGREEAREDKEEGNSFQL